MKERLNIIMVKTLDFTAAEAQACIKVLNSIGRLNQTLCEDYSDFGSKISTYRDAELCWDAARHVADVRDNYDYEFKVEGE